MSDGATILPGDLSRIQLPDVLTFLSMIRGSGKLVVRQQHLERTIHWKEGEIIFAHSNSPELPSTGTSPSYDRRIGSMPVA